MDAGDNEDDIGKWCHTRLGRSFGGGAIDDMFAGWGWGLGTGRRKRGRRVWYFGLGGAGDGAVVVARPRKLCTWIPGIYIPG
jgi:hypothetical protein